MFDFQFVGKLNFLKKVRIFRKKFVHSTRKNSYLINVKLKNIQPWQ